MTKLKALMASRKFWASVIGIAISIGLIGAENADALATAIVTIVSVFVGSTAVEDGLTRMGKAAE